MVLAADSGSVTIKTAKGAVDVSRLVGLASQVTSIIEGIATSKTDREGLQQQITDLKGRLDNLEINVRHVFMQPA